jgi:hypothetical protein
MASPDEFYNGTLDAFRQGKMATYAVFDLGLSPQLKLHELPRANVYLAQGVMRKALEKHHMDLQTLRNLPGLISNPLKLYRSNTEPGSIVFLLDLMHESEHVVAATIYDKHPDFGMCHWVKSLHHRAAFHFPLWEKQSLLIYKK